jgi:hypothetical protein
MSGDLLVLSVTAVLAAASVAQRGSRARQEPDEWGVRARSGWTGEERWAKRDGRILVTTQQQARELAATWNKRSGMSGPSYWAERITTGSFAREDPPWLSLALVKKAEPHIAARGVSKVARGQQSSSVTGEGFLQAYKATKGSVAAMRERSATENQTWAERRQGFISRHMGQAQANGESLWDGDEPSKRHLGLIAWAYSPHPDRVRKWLARKGSAALPLIAPRHWPAIDPRYQVAYEQTDAQLLGPGHGFGGAVPYFDPDDTGTPAPQGAGRTHGRTCPFGHTRRQCRCKLRAGYWQEG